jgi:hypothetical protein
MARHSLANRSHATEVSPLRVLVIDIGGSRVKLLATGRRKPVKLESGEDLTPQEMVDRVLELTADWKYDVVSLGYPGAVGPEGPTAEPGNLGNGWLKFDYEAALKCPVRMVNDAAMQALGAYSGEGRMLFLGLGTGLGSALVADRVLVPLELGSLRYNRKETLFDRLGKAGLKRRGKRAWLRSVRRVVKMLRVSMGADHVVFGGGNAELVKPLPPDCRRGHNNDAFTGGFRLWEEQMEHHDRPPSNVWRVVA